MANSFTVQELALPGVLLVTPTVYTDERGFSLTTYAADECAALGIPSQFVQDYVSYSKKDVIRGLHFQRAPHAQDKFVRCARGAVLDVVLDHDPASPTFRTHLAVELSAEKSEMLFVPGRYAHGFCVTSDEGALVEYKLSGGYHPEVAGGIRFDDPAFAINWPTASPVLSEQDKQWSLFSPPSL